MWVTIYSHPELMRVRVAAFGNRTCQTAQGVSQKKSGLAGSHGSASCNAVVVLIYFCWSTPCLQASRKQHTVAFETQPSKLTPMNGLPVIDGKCA